MRIAALLYALSWVALYVVCWYVGVLPLKRKGGILRAISPAGRRFRASALVSGRKITMYMHICAPFSYLRFRRLGSVVGTVRQVFLHSGRKEGKINTKRSADRDTHVGTSGALDGLEFCRNRVQRVCAVDFRPPARSDPLQ